MAGIRLERRQTISNQSEAVLRELILSGELPPGSRLNEVELAASLGISRGPLREAIQRLVAEGLLTLIAHRGAHVRTFHPEELRDLYELREALETHGCKLAATRATEAQLNQLDVLLSRTEEQLTGEDPYPTELDFHASVLSLAGNDALVAAARDVHRQIHLARSVSGHDPKRAREAYTEHRAVLTALQAGTAEAAADAMRSHLQRSAASAMQVLEAASAGGRAREIAG